jgi:hypothetical protein
MTSRLNGTQRQEREEIRNYRFNRSKLVTLTRYLRG